MPAFWRFGIPVFGELCDSVAGHLRWGTRWQSHATIVRKTCCGRHWKRSLIWAIRWCGWRAEIGWRFLDGRFASVCMAGAGQPPLPTRLVAGLFILKHMHDLSDEVLCARWLENPYYQFFCGELSFCHQLPFDRSSMTHWRQRPTAATRSWPPPATTSASPCAGWRGFVRPHPGALSRAAAGPGGLKTPLRRSSRTTKLTIDRAVTPVRSPLRQSHRSAAASTARRPNWKLPSRPTSRPSVPTPSPLFGPNPPPTSWRASSASASLARRRR